MLNDCYVGFERNRCQIKLIRKIRLEKGLTQEKLAELCYVTKSTLSNYERGVSNPSYLQALKISEVLGVDIKEILKNKDFKMCDWKVELS